MEQTIIYHNGECSKCRGALEILQERGIPYTARWYLADPLTKEELLLLLQKLRMNPSELIRKNEELYKKLFGESNLSDEEALNVLLKYPELMQRPIVEKGNVAIIARPPERVFEIIQG